MIHTVRRQDNSTGAANSLSIAGRLPYILATMIKTFKNLPSNFARHAVRVAGVAVVTPVPAPGFSMTGAAPS